MNEEILEQPQVDVDSKDTYEMSEDELVAHIKSLSGTEQPEPESNDEVVNDVNAEQVETTGDEPTPEADENTEDPYAKIAEILKQHPVKLRDSKLEVEVSDLDELIKLGSGGLNYTKKRQEEASLRKVGEYAQQHQLSMDDLELIADIKRGNKDAINGIAKRYGVDIYDVNTDAEYRPSQEVKYVERSEADEVAYDMQMNTPELFEQVRDTLSHVPRNVAEQIVGDGKILKAFKSDVENGIAQAVIPEAIKRASIYGGDFIEHYIEVANQKFAQQQPEPQQVAQQTKPMVSPTAKAKAGVSNSGATANGANNLDLWDNVSEDELLNRIRQQANLLKG